MANRERTEKFVHSGLWTGREIDAAVDRVLSKLGDAAFTDEAMSMIASELWSETRRHQRAAAKSRASYASQRVSA